MSLPEPSVVAAFEQADCWLDELAADDMEFS
jgi:hypothetical protein